MSNHAADPAADGPDPIDVAVGVRVRDLRNQRKMSQGKLGEAVGITFQQIQKYERGTNRISASMLVKLARALGVAPADLLPASDVTTAPSLNILANVRGADEMLKSYVGLPPKLQRAILRFARALAAEE